VCEELYLNTKEIVQRFKGTMEGNETMDTNVKFGGNKVLRRAFLVTMNGRNQYDLCGDYMEEFGALKNRSFVIVMNDELVNIIPNIVIEAILSILIYLFQNLKKIIFNFPRLRL